MEAAAPGECPHSPLAGARRRPSASTTIGPRGQLHIQPPPPAGAGGRDTGLGYIESNCR